MPTNGNCVKRSLREILADSHIAAVSIAVLLLWSLIWGFHALWIPLARAANFVFTAVAILGIPYLGPATIVDRLLLNTTSLFLFNALLSLAAAWLLSRWVYGVGPLRSLSKYRTRLAGRNHV